MEFNLVIEAPRAPSSTYPTRRTHRHLVRRAFAGLQKTDAAILLSSLFCRDDNRAALQLMKNRLDAVTKVLD